MPRLQAAARPGDCRKAPGGCRFAQTGLLVLLNHLVATVADDPGRQKTPSPGGGLGVLFAGLLPATSRVGDLSDIIAVDA